MRRVLSLVVCSLTLIMFLSSCGGSSEAKTSPSPGTDPDPIEYPEGVFAEVEAPLHVKKGEEVELTITVKNNTSESQKIKDILIDKDYLKAIAIFKTVPNYNNLIGVFGQKDYEFNLPIDVGEEIQFTFYGEAIEQGDYDAELSIDTSYEFGYSNKRIRTIID